MNPEHVLHEVGTGLANLLPALDNPDPVHFDQVIGHSMYLLNRLEDTEANKLLTGDIRVKLRRLRRGLVTALVMPLHSDEKANWATLLDDISGVAFHRSESLKENAEKLKSSRNQKKKAVSALRRARRSGWQGQLEVAGKILEEGVPSEEEQVQDAEVETVRNILKEGQWWDSEWRKIRDTRKFESLTLLPEDVTYGVTRFPIILIGGKVNPPLKKKLAAIGMSISTVFMKYTVLHNCRMMGVKSDLLPGNALYSQQLAKSILDKMKKEDPNLSSYILTTNVAKQRGSHTYFIIMPAQLNFNFWDWDFSNPKMENM